MALESRGVLVLGHTKRTAVRTRNATRRRPRMARPHRSTGRRPCDLIEPCTSFLPGESRRSERCMRAPACGVGPSNLAPVDPIGSATAISICGRTQRRRPGPGRRFNDANDAFHGNEDAGWLASTTLFSVRPRDGHFRPFWTDNDSLATASARTSFRRPHWRTIPRALGPFRSDGGGPL